jgi:hypothetical protein
MAAEKRRAAKCNWGSLSSKLLSGVGGGGGEVVDGGGRKGVE